MASRAEFELESVAEHIEDAVGVLRGLFSLMEQQAEKLERRIEAAGVTVWGDGGIATHLADESIALVALREKAFSMLEAERDAVKGIVERRLRRAGRTRKGASADAEAWLRRQLDGLKADEKGGQA